MSKDTTFDREEMRLIGEYVEGIRKEKQYDPISRLAEVDSLFWNASKIIRSGSAGQISIEEKKRLKLLINNCKRGRRPYREIQRAAMEIPTWAKPRDPGSIDVLKKLLDHDDKIIRITACKSLGPMGGMEAQKIIERLI